MSLFDDLIMALILARKWISVRRPPTRCDDRNARIHLNKKFCFIFVLHVYLKKVWNWSSPTEAKVIQRKLSKTKQQSSYHDKNKLGKSPNRWGRANNTNRALLSPKKEARVGKGVEKPSRISRVHFVFRTNAETKEKNWPSTWRSQARLALPYLAFRDTR